MVIFNVVLVMIEISNLDAGGGVAIVSNVNPNSLSLSGCRYFDATTILATLSLSNLAGTAGLRHMRDTEYEPSMISYNITNL